MPKIVVVNLNGDIPATELAKVVTLTIEGRTYPGKVEAIVEYVAPPAIPAEQTVSISGTGLKVVATPAPVTPP